MIKIKIVTPEKNIQIVQQDIREIQLVKSAIYSGVVTVYLVCYLVMKLYPLKVVHNSEKTFLSFFRAVETKLAMRA